MADVEYRRASLKGREQTLPREYYIDRAIFAREKEQIFTRSWVCVGRSEDIARAGDFLTKEIADENVIIVRAQGERVHAFFNVCRHRGTQLCQQKRGSFKNTIQCPYHAWTYALDGTLVAARNMDTADGFDRAKYPLHEARSAEFEGFLFVNVGRDDASFENWIAPLRGRFADWKLSNLRSVRRIEYALACNWKLAFQNYTECYHCPVIHPQLEKLSPWDSGRNDLDEGPFLGGYSELRGGEVTLHHKRSAPRPAINRNLTGRVYYYTIFPSLLLSLHPDYVMAHYVRPVDVDRTQIICEWFFEPSTIERRNFDPSDAIDFWDLTNRQDWKVNELTQRGVRSRRYTPGPYSQAEGLLAAFDRHYLEQMD